MATFSLTHPACLFVLCVCSFQVRVALCQLSVTKDRDANIDHAKKAIEKAADQGAQLVVLPVSYSLLSPHLISFHGDSTLPLPV